MLYFVNKVAEEMEFEQGWNSPSHTTSYKLHTIKVIERD